MPGVDPRNPDWQSPWDYIANGPPPPAMLTVVFAGSIRPMLDRYGTDYTLHPSPEDGHDLIAQWPSGYQTMLLVP